MNENKINKYVVVKFKNGRAISGFLRKDLTLKLGVKIINVNTEDVVSIKEI